MISGPENQKDSSLNSKLRDIHNFTHYLLFWEIIHFFISKVKSDYFGKTIWQKLAKVGKNWQQLAKVGKS